jgi:pimeloyl-ACP methyl ester carboxylesterase
VKRPRLRRAALYLGLLAVAIGCRRSVPAVQGGRRHVVLLVPGYAGGKPMMWGTGRYLHKSAGLEERLCRFSDYGIMKPIPEYATELDAIVKGLGLAPGDRLDLVAFSMGGLVCRYWLEEMDGRANRLIAVCTPHHGTTKGSGFADTSSSVRDLQPGSDFLKKLNDGSRPEGVGYHSVRLSGDRTIRPGCSALLPGARNYEIPGRLHSAALYRKCVWELIRDIIEDDAPSSGPQELSAEQRRALGLD